MEEALFVVRILAALFVGALFVEAITGKAWTYNFMVDAFAAVGFGLVSFLLHLDLHAPALGG